MRSTVKGMRALYDAKAHAENFMHHGRVSITPTVASLYIGLMMLEEAILPRRRMMGKNKFSKWCIAYDKTFVALGRLGYMASEIRVGK